MSNKVLYTSFFFLYFSFWANTQSMNDTTSLSLPAAINIALANNHDLKIQRQFQLIADNNVSKANAGQLPTLDAVGNASYTNNFTTLDLRTFQPEPPVINISESGVETATASAGVEANYMLWDGGQSKHRYQLLQGLSNLEEAKQKVIISGIVEGIMGLYFQVLKLQNQETILQDVVLLTKERIKKLDDKLAFGKSNKLAILQAQTNLNQDLSALDQLDLAKTNLLLDLKRLMNDDSEQLYRLVAEKCDLNIPSAATIGPVIIARNPALALMDQGISIAAIQLLLAESAGQPTLVSFANVGYFWQRNDVQQLAEIQNIGGTIGISARYNLYDGGVKKNKIQNAQIASQIESLRRTELEDELLNTMKKEIASLNLIKSQLDREATNLETYRQNYDKVNEQYQLGKLPAITLREAQLALTQSKLVSANLKVEFVHIKSKIQLLMGTYVE